MLNISNSLVAVFVADSLMEDRAVHFSVFYLLDTQPLRMRDTAVEDDAVENVALEKAAVSDAAMEDAAVDMRP